MRGSATEQTEIWTIALTDFVFMAGVMFIVNDKDAACLTCDTENFRFQKVFGWIRFRLSAKILDTLLYSGLYRFALRMETDPVLTVLAFKL